MNIGRKLALSMAVAGFVEFALVGLAIGVFFYQSDRDHRDLHVSHHSFPTRRSSDLVFPRMSSPKTRGSFLRRSLAGSLDFGRNIPRSEEHTSELQSLTDISYAVF